VGWAVAAADREMGESVAREESEKGARGGYSHPIEYWGAT